MLKMFLESLQLLVLSCKRIIEWLGLLFSSGCCRRMSLREKNKSGPSLSAYGRRAQIWHAFNALDEQKKGEVLKSQLKVFSYNLITCLGLTEADNVIDAFMPESSSLTFEDYMKFIDEILSKTIRKSNIANDVSIPLEKLDMVCWFVCSKVYVSQTGRFLDQTNCFKLWCVFNILAHTDEKDEPICPVEIDVEEVEILLTRIHKILGMVFKKDILQQQVRNSDMMWKFPQLLKIVETYIFGLDLNVVGGVLSEVHDEFILGVFKKGYLTKKGHFITNWKERWCVLTPSTLRYFVSRDEKELKGEIKITSKCTVENLSDKIGAKQCRFLLKSEGKDYEMFAPDPITKNEWLSALNSAISFHTNADQKELTMEEIRQRRISRLARREKLTAEQMHKLKQKELMDMTQQQLEQEIMKSLEMEKRIREDEEKRLKDQELMAKTKEELEAVKKARAEAEKRWAEEADRLELEKQHLRELQELHKQLAVQLEKEKEAREQEELSRRRQEEITEAERVKKIQLEEIQTALEQLLHDEKQKREDLEEAKHQQEALLREERQRLEQLEIERKQRDLEYELALQKLQEAELEKEEAHRMLRKKKETPFGSALYKFVENEANDQILVNPGSHRGKGFLSREDSMQTEMQT